MPASRPTEQRFWEKVNKAGECWEWTASCTPFGHGKFHAPEAGNYAHRYSWMLHIGPIPAEMQVLHHCDNPKCVRPDHLFLGTNADNMADRNNKKRAKGGNGHRPKKLTVEAVNTIRTQYAAGGHTHRGLAKTYGVAMSVITRIISREIWSHI